MSDTKSEMKKTIRCLYIAVEESIADDVMGKVMACVTQLESTIAELRAEMERREARYLKLNGKQADAIAELQELLDWYDDGAEGLLKKLDKLEAENAELRQKVIVLEMDLSSAVRVLGWVRDTGDPGTCPLLAKDWFRVNPRAAREANDDADH